MLTSKDDLRGFGRDLWSGKAYSSAKDTTKRFLAKFAGFIKRSPSLLWAALVSRKWRLGQLEDVAEGLQKRWDFGQLDQSVRANLAAATAYLGRTKKAEAEAPAPVQAVGPEEKRVSSTPGGVAVGIGAIALAFLFILISKDA